MENENYSNAYAEVLHYLKGVSEESLKKIPSQFLEFLNKNKNASYRCNFDYTKPLKQLQLLDETRRNYRGNLLKLLV